MIYREIGKSGMKGSVLHVGTFPFVFENVNDPDNKEGIATMRQAIELGINVFDTAEGYGGGRAESLLAEAIKGMRDKVYIESKIAFGNLRAADIRKSCEGSLKRLNTDYLDIEYIHIPNPGIPLEETMGALLKLREEGKIRAIGVSNFNKDELEAALKIGRVDLIQNIFSMLWRWMEEELIPFCVANDVSFIPCSPLVQGILSGKFSLDTNLSKLDGRKRIQLFTEERFGKAVVVAEGVKYLAKKYGKTPTQVALNWTLSQFGIHAVVIGARNRKQLLENVGSLGWQLAKEDLVYLDKLSRTLTDTLPHDISFWWVGKFSM
jgi:myo-inositol catabolism protein IolS